MEKSKDCPLCGKKNAIKLIPYERKFRANPGPKGIIGNYKIMHSGGGYDYSHAESCPKLVHAYEKKYLLQFYVDGYSDVNRSDGLDFEDYEKFFLQNNFKLEVICKRNSPSYSQNKWTFEASLYFFGEPFDVVHLVSEGKEPERAFEKLKHRLLCGDLIETEKGVKLQLVSTYKKLCKLKPVKS
ncbi:MAG: hypothetical protein KBC42_02770 [Candidatus Pacebacteria bacterium]|nr:hypothetical protein [Candidatus Paceibacterota bacterium]MBP9780824.1 hypothetical protein [Candidatus Paceibacterota bacterium]